MILETKRLRLRKLAKDDAAFVLRLVNEPAFLAHIGDKEVRNLDDARRFIQEGAWTNQPRPGYGQLLVELQDSGEPIGVCGLLYRPSLDVTDVGFALLSPYHRQGYAYEAATAVLQYGRSTLGIPHIVALTSPENTASIRLIEKLGMQFEKVVQMWPDDPGTFLYA